MSEVDLRAPKLDAEPCGDALFEGREDLQLIQRHLEAWSARQEAVLQVTLDRIEGLCANVALSERRLHMSGGGASIDASSRMRPPSTPSVDISCDVQDGGAKGRVLNDVSVEIASPVIPTSPKRPDWRKMKTLTTATLPCRHGVVHTLLDAFSAGAEDHWSSCRTKVASLVDSGFFSFLCGAVILCNAATIAYSTDMAVQEAIQGIVKYKAIVDSLEVVFISFYLVELVLRIFVRRLSFLRGMDGVWNALDMLLVALATYDVVLMLLGSKAQSTNVSFMRLLRTLKVVRTWRTVRVLRMLRELRMMLESIFGGMRSMLWAMVMVALVTFMFGCCFTQSMSMYLSDLPAAEDATQAEVLASWGTVLLAMNTLFMCGTGGQDWRVPARHLQDFSVAVYLLFLIYISFFLFLVTNTLTSIIMEATMERATKDRNDVIADGLKKKYQYIKMFKELYETLDEDGSGDVSMQELRKHLQDERTVAFFQHLDIDATDIEQFFATLSMDGTNTLDVETFVVGCMKLKGVARSMDLLCLYNSHCAYVRANKHFQATMTTAVDDLQGAVSAIRRRMDAPCSSQLQGDPYLKL